MTDEVRVRRPFLALSVSTSILGLAALWFSWTAFPPQWTVEFAVLLLAAVISENYAVAMGGYGFSLGFPLTMASLVLCGPTNALIVAISASTTLVDARKFHWSVTLYNLGQFLLCTSLAAWAYVSLDGRVLLASGEGPFSAADFPAVLLPLMVTIFVMSLGNVALACLGVSVKNRIPLSQVVESVGWLPWGQVALGAVGFLMAQVMAINVAAFVFLVFPLTVARQFYQRYTSLKSAFTDTIRSLIGALEAKDPYTRGHSERVARYAVAIGQAHGLDPRELNDLENAALLHDLGKLALPGALLRKQERLSDDDWNLIKQHPVVGAEMVGRIPPLKRLSLTVRGHHERLDGSGYPEGAKSDALGLHVRILAIADSYDAMTSDRPYRPGLDMASAVQELERCSESQLDPVLVSELISTLPQPEASSPAGASGILAAVGEEVPQ